MAKKFKTLYQVCPDERSGSNILHDNVEDAIKEALDDANQTWLEDRKEIVLHICEIRDIMQVGPDKKKSRRK